MEHSRRVYSATYRLLHATGDEQYRAFDRLTALTNFPVALEMWLKTNPDPELVSYVIDARIKWELMRSPLIPFYRHKETQRMTREETITTILLAVAQGEVPCFEMGYECLYCHAEGGKPREYAIKVGDYVERVKHSPNCPIVLARQILREQGTPLNIYKVVADRFITRDRRHKPHWMPVAGHTLALSEQEAIRNWTNNDTRNIVVTFVAELPAYEEGQTA